MCPDFQSLPVIADSCNATIIFWNALLAATIVGAVAVAYKVRSANGASRALRSWTFQTNYHNFSKGFRYLPSASQQLVMAKRVRLIRYLSTGLFLLIWPVSVVSAYLSPSASFIGSGFVYCAVVAPYAVFALPIFVGRQPVSTARLRETAVSDYIPWALRLSLWGSGLVAAGLGIWATMGWPNSVLSQEVFVTACVLLALRPVLTELAGNTIIRRSPPAAGRDDIFFFDAMCSQGLAVLYMGALLPIALLTFFFPVTQMFNEFSGFVVLALSALALIPDIWATTKQYSHMQHKLWPGRLETIKQCDLAAAQTHFRPPPFPTPGRP